jgi:PIN domain nuclease of toxin-antitoxin system
VRLLLDTVTFIWSVRSPERISKRAMAAMVKEDARRELSALSLSEIAIKGNAGKLDLSKEATLAGIADLEIRILPYAADHAYRLFGLPRHHTDPFDRHIIAQALAEDIPIVTSDNSFRLYTGLKVIW